MNWFKYFRLIGNSQKRPLSKSKPRNTQQRLTLETLEAREVPAVPFIQSVTPGIGGTLGTAITVKYSEDVMGASTASNYRLFASDGTLATISTVAYNSGTSTATILASNLSVNGAPLTAGTYSLFLRGDQISSVSTNEFLARPGELVVANAAKGNLSTVSLNGTNLGAVSTVGLPAQGTTNHLPTAVAITDINNDTFNDLFVASGGQNNISIFLGDSAGGYSKTADLILDLPTGAAPNAILLRDLNADNKLDLVTANKSTNNVSVFLNQNTTPGELAFGTIANYTVGAGTLAVAAGKFNNDASIDLVATSSASDASNNYNIFFLANNGDGTFATSTAFIVGNTTPTDLTVPSSIAVGKFNNDNLDDIVVGGTSGVSTLINTATGATFAFTPTFTAVTGGVTSVATGTVRTGGNTIVDVVATSANGTGEVLAFLNDGTGLFQSTGSIAAGVAAPTGLVLRNIDGVTGLELVYTNNAAAGGVVSRARLQTGLVADATNAGPIVITSNGHNLVVGQQVIIAGVQGNTAANGTFFITTRTTDTFTLGGSTGNGAAVANTGTWIAVPGVIINVTKASGQPIVVTSQNHGLRTGQQITIAGVGGATGANGTFFITRIDANSYSLNGTAGTALGGSYTANTGTWTLAPYTTGAGAVSVALGDSNGDSIADLVTANNTDNTLSLYSGSGSGGVGDGTFLSPTNLLLSGTKTRPTDPAVGDLNGDGIPDLVVADSRNSSGTNNQVNVFLGLAGGGYANAVTLNTQTGGNSRIPVSVALGDLNGDGKLDIVAASQQDNNVAIFLNTSSGGNLTFASPTRVTVGRTPTEVVLADINNDGDLDMLVAHNGGGGGTNRGVTVRLGNGNGTFQTSTEVASGTRATGLAVADFNRDGKLDFAVIDDNTPGRVRIRSGAGNGTFTNGGDFTVGSNPTDITVGDFNSDGFVDIATASRNNTTTDNVSVLLNNLGTGFQTAIQTNVAVGLPLQSIEAVNINNDAFLDLVVTSRPFDAPGKGSPPPPPNPVNNTHVLLGAGDGSFTVTNSSYSIDIPTTTPVSPAVATPTPSFVSVVSDPFKLLSTFNVGGTTVSVNLLRNGTFENRDLNGEQGNLTGWSTSKLRDTTLGSAGGWNIQTGGSSPLSLTTVPTPTGRYRAMLDQQNLRPFQGNTNPNSDASYAGSHAIYQDVFIPANANSVKLSFSLYINSASAFTDAASNPALDYRTGDPNQQVRVDIMAANNNFLDVGTGVLQNIFQSQPTDAQVRTVTFSGGTAVDLSAFKGQTIRLRVAATNNQGKLIVGLDNVAIQTVFTDAIAPTLNSINLRNPSFLAGPNTLEQSTDPTVVGQVTDNGTINNIKQIAFDIANNGFGGTDDVVITTLDSNGYFMFTASNLLPGVQNIPVEIMDRAGNTISQTFKFILQGPSLTNWQSSGPGPIDISSAGFNYNTVSGKITGIATDPADPSGNTIFVSSSNGGIWRSVDGGRNWLALTDNVRDLTGQRINTAIGGLTFGSNAAGTVRAIYAATGVDDTAFTSRSSVGVLRSLDDGRTWQVLGGRTTTSSGIFAGARVSKIVVDPSNPAIVYVAITSWDDSTKQPMILKSTNATAANPANVTWTNVLVPTNMFANGGPLAGSTDLASVTDLIVDPFNPSRIIMGLGNIGQRAANDTAGVWLSTDGGGTWILQRGGDNPAISNNTLPNGQTVGRVTLAQGVGRVGDEATIYVLMSNPPAGANPSQFNQGDYLGLFKSKDNMLNFTQVMLKQPGVGHARYTETYVDIGLLGNEGATVGALAVDPNNRNVVYVGGSRRFDTTGTPQHALIRVDTGNMRDTTYLDPATGTIVNDGDDIDKAAAAAANSDKYPEFTDPNTGSTIGGVAYDGEGVYWYDIEQAKASDSSQLRRLPPSIHRIAFDTQGRLLFGTENGLYRGVPLGFGYDFDSSFAGILDGNGGGGGGGAFNPPGMNITELNGNLQITDLTSAAIDPTNRNQLYISASGVGTATTGNGGVGAWQSVGLTGPNVAGVGNLGIPNSFQIVAANLNPDAPADAVSTLYRTWQFNGQGSLIPEVSVDGGGSFSTGNSAGISSQDAVTVAPVLAINGKKAIVDGVFYDELLFGTNKVYVSRTGGAVFDQIVGSSLGTLNEFYSALAFSPTDGVYLAGTDRGRVFRTINGAFQDITGNLSTLLGTVVAKVNGITVDPNNPNTIYVMLSVPNGNNSVYRSTSGGTTWSAVTGGLPLTSSYKLIIDPRPSTGALNGRMYLGTDRGVFTSVNGGANWVELGNGLPAAPVVDLQFNATHEILAAVLQGRGVFQLSTARSGPAITTVTPSNVLNTGAGLSNLTVNFNTPVDPRTFNAASNDPARVKVALALQQGTEYLTQRIRELELQYRRITAQPVHITSGLTTFTGMGNSELEYIATLLASPFYYSTVSNNTNTGWVDQVYQDLFGRNSAGDPQEPDLVAALGTTNASTGQATRLGILRQLVGINPSGFNNPLAVEFLTRHVASLYNRYLGANAAVAFPATGAYAAAISATVNTLQSRTTPYAGVFAGILSTTSAYQKAGNDYALPAGVTANSVSYGNLTGSTDSFGRQIPDLIVAGSDNNLYVFKGKTGGGYALTPDLVLALPANASPAQIAVGDFNADSKTDIAVSNSGLTGVGGVSVFLNTRTMSGQLSFGTRADLDGGNNPIGIAIADLDGDMNSDIAVVNRTLNGSNNYTASVLLGNGMGGFGTLNQFKVGDNNPNAAELTAPTGIAVGNVTGGVRRDIVVSGDNGVVVLNNTTTTPGTPTFTLLGARLTNTPTTSVAIGALDSDNDLEIVATSPNAAGEIIVFRNDDSVDTFTSSLVSVGANPRTVKLADLNGDGKLDVAVANNVTGGGITTVFNTTTPATSGPDTITFGTPVSYPVTGDTPAAIDLADTNQDGLADFAIGYSNSEFVSLNAGKQQGVLQTPNDRNWITWLYRSLANRTPTAAERSGAENTLISNYLVYLNGADGAMAPLAITPANAENTSYTATFAPQVADGVYALWVGPNASGANLRDFTDLNGTFVNTGNAHNQNQNAFNGENPGDRIRTRFVVTTSDNGDFISALFRDFQGVTSSGGRPADHEGYIALSTLIDPARLTAMSGMATNFARSAEATERYINELYQRFLRRLPVGAELTTPRDAIQAGTLTFRQFVVNRLASTAYFTEPQVGINGDNAAWLNQIYLDLLAVPGMTADAGFATKVANLNAGTQTRLQIATNLVFGDAAIKQTISEYFQEYLGRGPVRNSDPALDETTNFGGIDFTALLRQAPTLGGASPDQQLIAALLRSSEYLRVVGNTNFDWVKSLYLKLYNRPSIDTTLMTGLVADASNGSPIIITSNAHGLVVGQRVTIAGVQGNTAANGTFTITATTTNTFTLGGSTGNGTAVPNTGTWTVGAEFNGKLNNILAGYATQRQTSLNMVLNSQEARNRFYTDYYTQFLSRTPSALELTTQQSFYAANGNRLEAVIANILRSNEYFPLSGPGSANSTWLDSIYQALLGRSTFNDPTATQRLNFLNSQPANQLSNARLTVALQVLNSTEYRRIFVTNVYNTYLGRTPTTTERDFWVTEMNVNGLLQQSVIIRLLKDAEYFNKQ